MSWLDNSNDPLFHTSTSQYPSNNYYNCSHFDVKFWKSIKYSDYTDDKQLPGESSLLMLSVLHYAVNQKVTVQQPRKTHYVGKASRLFESRPLLAYVDVWTNQGFQHLGITYRMRFILNIKARGPCCGHYNQWLPGVNTED